ncbi:acylphosphatase [Anaeramoeba flamelloides]|uniref:acylphosphatase n=1 Tax=Anaeramoeba flamelloides TaxID=1746091 RepID=A0AAV8A4Y5_9EUKA|nr:acylphosphatase [Anaeramoeba flamelloides]|eukprot:Anaeramoba_flamelloidesa570095_6.p1 GENE.a570095_6~~a570095_6.p1  ORF type:complete len:109 (-),score=23.85 a570095_6:51-377(-)
MTESVTKYFRAIGDVQGVFFRKTICLAAKFKGLVGGASNLSNGQVEFILTGKEDTISQLIKSIEKTKPLNNFGAEVIDVLEVKKGRDLESHQMTTLNVTSFSMLHTYI